MKTPQFLHPARVMKHSALALTAAALGLALLAPSAQAAPTNDNLADAIELSGNSCILTGVDGTGATLEVSEPYCVYDPSPMGTVWFKWACTQTGTFSMNTVGSEPNAWDVNLAIYSGAADATFAGLTKVHEQDYIDSETVVSMSVTEGNTYYIQLCGNYNDATDIHLQWDGGVSPIIWGDAQNIAGDSDVSTNGTLAYAEIWGGTPGTVNGVPFTAAGVNVTTVNPFGNNGTDTSSLPGSAAYQGILNSLVHNYPGLMTLNNLVAGHPYEVQVWSYQRGAGSTLNLIETNTVSLNSVIGQYVIGTFTASGTSLNLHTGFNYDPYAGPIINAVQVRDLTPLPAGTTTTTVTSSSNPSTFGDAVIFTATIHPASGTDVPTGSVQFKVDGSDLGSPVVVAAGTSPDGTATSDSTSAITVAGSPHEVTAVYTPDTSAFTTSTGTLTGGQTVNEPPIGVGTTGSGILTFDALPAATEWSTVSVAGSSSEVTTDAMMDTAMGSITASSISSALVATTAGAAQNVAFYRSDLGKVETLVAGSNKLTLLMATLANTSGSTSDRLTVSYTMGLLTASPAEQIKGHRVYWSKTGAAGEWTAVGDYQLTVANTTQNVSFDIPSLAWAVADPLYVVWVDDNGSGTEGDYTLDDVSFAPTPPQQLAVAITSPAEGANVVANFTISATASVYPGTVDSVDFYLDDELLGNDASAPFTWNVTGAALGAHTLKAVAHKAGDSDVTSTVVNVTVVTVLQVNVDTTAGDAGAVVGWNNLSVVTGANQTFTDIAGTGLSATLGTVEPYNGQGTAISDGSKGTSGTAFETNTLGRSGIQGNMSMTHPAGFQSVSMLLAACLIYKRAISRPYADAGRVAPTTGCGWRHAGGANIKTDV